MKTTFDLPDELVRELKLRAIHDGRKLKDAAADVLRAGLAVARSSAAAEKPAVVGKDKKTRLPVILCRRSAPRDQELTPDRVAQILAAQDVGWNREAGGNS